MSNSFVKHLPSLDGLRAVSVLLVVFGHSVGYGIAVPDYKVFKLVLGGDVGVRVFFILSGFLITHILKREHEHYGNISLSKFYLRRTFRIIPLTYVYIIGTSLLLYSLGLTINFSDLLQGLLFITPAVSKSTWEFAHLWSLAVEEQFYLIWPFVFYFFYKKRYFSITAVVILLVPLILRMFDYPVLRRFELLRNADFLMMGCILALNYDKLKGLVSIKFPIVFRLILILVVYFSYFAYVYLIDTWIIKSLFWFVQGVAISALVYLYIEYRNGFDYAFLNTRYMIMLGKSSFSIYLWQQLFTSPQIQNNLSFVVFPYDILFSVISGLVSYFTVEKLFLGIKNKFQRGTV